MKDLINQIKDMIIQIYINIVSIIKDAIKKIVTQINMLKFW
jgi:hypothetical protein